MGGSRAGVSVEAAQAVVVLRDGGYRGRRTLTGATPITTALRGKEKQVSNETHEVPPVSGYRPLTQQQVDLMNKGKAIFEQVGAYLDELATYSPAPGPQPGPQPGEKECLTTDPRSIAIARTEAQTAAMWAMRAITKPGGFA